MLIGLNCVRLVCVIDMAESKKNEDGKTKKKEVTVRDEMYQT